MKEALKKSNKAFSMAIIIPNSEYKKYMEAMAKEISKQYNAICYVSLNRLAPALSASMEKNKTNQKKFFLIDGITQALVPKPKEFSNCIYVKGASAMKQLNISTTESIATGMFDCMIIDSISTLKVYNKNQDVIKFIKTQLMETDKANCTAIFTCIEDEMTAALTKQLEKTVDQIVVIPKSKTK